MKNNKLFQIGEVASLCGITRRMLLNYEAVGLISPTLTDKISNYRYYDFNAVSKVNMILDLRQIGMSLPEIKRYLNEDLSIPEQIKILEERIAATKKAIDQLRLRDIKKNSVNEVKEVRLPEACCICNEIIADTVHTAIKAYADTFNECLKKGVRLISGAYSFCEFQSSILNNDFYETNDIKMKVCICIAKENLPHNAIVFPETKAVSVLYCGTFDNSIIAYEKLRNYIIEKKIKPAGYPREFYIQGEFSNDPDDNIVCVAIPIE